MNCGYLDPKREYLLDGIRDRNSVKPLRRLDFGQNSDGCDPEVARYLSEALGMPGLALRLREYPPFDTRLLREKISALHGVRAESVLITAGGEQAIGLVANAFLGRGDQVVVAEPSFFVFEAFSVRNGARVLRVELDEQEGFLWGARAFEGLRERLPYARVLWLANPNNPTGRALPSGMLEEILAQASKHGCIVVVDEAYGEYTDPKSGVASASSVLCRFPRTIVLRTFSKAFGLAGLRIGYVICEDPKLLAAIASHGYNFPVSRLSMDAASIALDRLEHLESTRLRTRARIAQLMEALDGTVLLEAVPTQCCICMIRHLRRDAAELSRLLERQGILTCRIPGRSRAARSYIRVSIGDEQENRALIAALSRIGTGASTVEGS